MACKGQIDDDDDYYYYYFIVNLTTSEAHLSAVHKLGMKHMKHRKGRTMLIALINSCCCRRRRCCCCRRRYRCCCGRGGGGECRLTQSTFTVALTLLTSVWEAPVWTHSRDIDYSDIFFYLYLILGHHSFLQHLLQPAVWCHLTFRQLLKDNSN
jgi:hypothetical protein